MYVFYIFLIISLSILLVYVIDGLSLRLYKNIGKDIKRNSDRTDTSEEEEVNSR